MSVLRGFDPRSNASYPLSTPCAAELMEGSRKPRRVRVSTRYPLSPPVLFLDLGGREKGGVLLQEKGEKRAGGKYRKRTGGKGG